MDDDLSFEALAARLQSGDPDAAAEVFSRYVHRLVGLARKLLRDDLRSKMDPDDLVQAAFKSFFHRFTMGQFAVVDWDSLWGILTTITTRKVSQSNREYRSQRRDVRREIPIDGGDPEFASDLPAERMPTLQEAAELADLVQKLVARLTPHDREILLLSMDERKPSEVADLVGCHARTVLRALGRIRNEARSLFGV